MKSRKRTKSNWDFDLNSHFSSFSGSHANQILHLINGNLPVPGTTGVTNLQNGFHNRFHFIIRRKNFNFCFRKIKISFRPRLLITETFDVTYLTVIPRIPTAFKASSNSDNFLSLIIHSIFFIHLSRISVTRLRNSNRSLQFCSTTNQNRDFPDEKYFIVFGIIFSKRCANLGVNIFDEMP